jgi:hypothetical protein
LAAAFFLACTFLGFGFFAGTLGTGEGDGVARTTGLGVLVGSAVRVGVAVAVARATVGAILSSEGENDHTLSARKKTSPVMTKPTGQKRG